jgi:hypothetical protein
MTNVYVRGDTLRKRPGSVKLGDRLSASERVMSLFSAWDEDDNVFLFAMTQTGLRRYTPGTDVWTLYTGPAFTGGAERFFSWDISQNAVVTSNGVDQVVRIPFAGTVYAILDADCPAAAYLTRFADRLYLAKTVESGVNKPFRVRRAVNGDHTDWTGLGSGFNDLSEYPYHIKGLRKHGAQMLIPSEQTFWIATRTGIAGAPARFDPIIPGTGVYMPRTLTTRGMDHLFYARDHAYMFTGQNVSEIMNQVRDIIFFNLEAGKIHMNFSVIRPESQEWITWVCEAGDTTPSAAWVWNWHYNICYKWDFAGSHPICAEIHRQDQERVWDALVGDWDSQSWEWTASENTENFPLLVTGHADGYVRQWREDYTSDDGTLINCRWTSKDFNAALVSPENSQRQIALKRLLIEYQASGTDCTLSFYLSNNGGESWEGPYSVNLAASADNTTGYYTAVMSDTISGDKIRFKFEHSDLDEKFRIARFIPEFEILGTLIIHDEAA